jgi:hypothetical protein
MIYSFMVVLRSERCRVNGVDSSLCLKASEVGLLSADQCPRSDSPAESEFNLSLFVLFRPSRDQVMFSILENTSCFTQTINSSANLFLK